MEIIILVFFILFTLYLFWLLAVVYKWDIKAFLFISSEQKQLPLPESEQKSNNIEVDILGHTKVTEAISQKKIPEPESIQPLWVEKLEMTSNNEEEISESGPEMRDITLTKEEQEELKKMNELDSFWRENDPEEGFTADDVRHAAETFAGIRTSDADLERTKNTLKHVPEDFIELFVQHSINDKKIKDMLSEYLDQTETETNQPLRIRLKEFIVEDHID